MMSKPWASAIFAVLGLICAVRLEGQFHSEQTLARGADASAPDVAAAGSNVYVVWQETIAGHSRIQFVRSTDEGVHFESVETLSADGRDATLPRIAATGGDVYVVWEERAIAGHPDVWLRRSTNGGATFSAGEPVSDPSPGRDSQRPAIAVAGPAVYIAWQERFVGGSATDFHQIYFRASSGTGTLSPPKRISPAAADAREPDVAAAGSAVYVAWQEHRGETEPREAFLARSLDEGETFDAPLDISPSFGVIDSAHPALAATGSLIYIAWERTDNAPTRAVYGVSADQGVTFHAPVGVGEAFDVPGVALRVAAEGSSFSVVWQDGAPDGRIRVRSPSVPRARGIVQAPKVDLSSGDARSPSVARAGARIYAVWEAAASAGLRQIVLRRSIAPPGIAPSNLSATRDSHSVSASVAAAGPDVYVVWSEGTAEESLDILFKASTDSGQTFTNAINLSATPGASTTPRVAAAGQAVFVAWEDDTGTAGTPSIRFRRSLDRGVTWDPPLPSPPATLSVFPGVMPAAARLPTLAAEGAEVYVGWEREETSDLCHTIFGRRSLDQGLTWDPPLDPATAPMSLSCARTSACELCRAYAPALAASGPTVHLAFKLYLLGEISASYCFDRRERLPGCGGATVPSQFTLDDKLSLDDEGPRLAAAGSSVHAIWMRRQEVRFRTVRLDPMSFVPALKDPPGVLSTPGTPSQGPSVAADGPEAYAAWWSDDANRILFRRSKDGGIVFEAERIVSLPGDTATGPPSLAAAGPEVFLTWDELRAEDTRQEVFLRSSTNEGAAFCESPDLAIDISGPSDGFIGESVSYAVTVVARGCSVAGVRVVAESPGLRDTRWCRGIGCVPQNEEPLVDVIPLLDNQPVTYTLTGFISPLASDSVRVTASVVPPPPLTDPRPADNTAVFMTRIVLPSGVTPFCAGIEGSSIEGATVTYIFVLRAGSTPQPDNPGPEFTDVLPAGLMLLGGTAYQGTVSIVANTLAWNGAIAAGGSVTIRVVAQIGPGTSRTILCNPGTSFFDADGDGSNESSRTSDACCFRVSAEIPALETLAVLLTVLLVAAAGVWRVLRA